MAEHCYGWRRDSLDARDYHLTLAPPAQLPPMVDLRPLFPAPYDQLQLGSCVGCGVAAAVQYERRRQHLPDWVPSRLMIYWQARSYEGSTRSDAGCEIRDGVKAAAKVGVCPEPEWPYLPSKYAVKPSSAAFRDAAKHEAAVYSRVAQDVTAIKTALAAGLPVLIGISVFASFESQAVAQTGFVPMPQPGEQLLGGHCMLVVGYRDDQGVWITRNSWGLTFGDAGHVYLPYPYLASSAISGDFWVISQETPA